MYGIQVDAAAVLVGQGRFMGSAPIAGPNVDLGVENPTNSPKRNHNAHKAPEWVWIAN